MGVKELFPRTKSAQQKVNLLECVRGKRVGVDAYVWLHALAIRHAPEVVLHGKFSNVVASFVERAKWLLRCGTAPVFVFDGAPVPAKDVTAEARARRRAKAFAAAEQASDDAEPCSADLRAAVKVEWRMVVEVISELRTQGFQYVVAPYEADSQLIHLEKSGCIDAILTVDSDLVALGGKHVYFHINYYTGDAMLLEQKNLFAERTPGKHPTQPLSIKRAPTTPTLK